MRQTLLTVVLVLGIVLSNSCSKVPNNIIHQQKSEAADWVMKPGATNPELTYDTYYQISPTWGQAFYYASQRKDYILTTIIGLILFVGFAIVFYGKTADASWLPKIFNNSIVANVTLFVFFLSSVYFLTGNASSVKWNNYKWVKKEVYDKAIKEAGSTQPIWDSIEVNHLIIDGPY